jgi:hypothetical protein
LTQYRPPKAPEWSGRHIARLRTRFPTQLLVPWPSIEPHGSRPSFTPRRLAAARTAFVRAEIIPAWQMLPAPSCARTAKEKAPPWTRR